MTSPAGEKTSRFEELTLGRESVHTLLSARFIRSPQRWDGLWISTPLRLPKSTRIDAEEIAESEGISIVRIPSTDRSTPE